MTFERYTEKARRAIFYARYEAANLPTGYIEPEHLLLGLLREDALLKIKLINQKGSAEGLREELERGIRTTGESIATTAELPLSREAEDVLSRAAQEAEGLRHRSIDCGHLVLGVFAMSGKAAEALDHQGVTYHAYREALAGAPEPAQAPEMDPEPAAAEPAAEEPAMQQAAAPSLREPVSKLNQMIEQVFFLVAATDEEFGAHRLKRKPWTRKEALGHLIDWAALHHGWFARALTEPKLTASGYPEDSWVAALRYSEVPWRTLLELWAALNGLLVHILANMPEEKLGMSCRIGIEEPKTLHDLIAGYIEHCEDLAGQILAHG